ncbi:MAG: thiamine phosphate synthase, partial [Alistipes sp.]|nr:thiamine phosphate synthase [Alistipes sp.]
MQSSSILSLHHAPVLLTLPQIVAGEAETLALLSNESDTLIHLRKPEASPEALESLLQALVHQGADLSRFTLHYNEPLARRYGVGGVHLHPEELLKGLGCGLRRSTSTHSWAEAAQMASLCDYLFLSPLFDSISKPGYHSRFTPDEASAQLHPHHGQIVA